MDTKLGCVISVNVAKPRPVQAGGASVLTAIFKTPVQGRVAVRGNNLEGDRQADLTVHGGPHKAVYGYPHEHYSYWRDKLPQTELPPGMFGENLTTEGFTEGQIFIGDTVRIGSAVLQVTQPRMPCYKLGIRFGRPDIVKLFWQSGRSGFYFSVVEEGEITAGDTIERIAQTEELVSVSEVGDLSRATTFDQDLLRRALVSPLKGGWKEMIQERWITSLSSTSS